MKIAKRNLIRQKHGLQGVELVSLMYEGNFLCSLNQAVSLQI